MSVHAIALKVMSIKDYISLVQRLLVNLVSTFGLSGKCDSVCEDLHASAHKMCCRTREFRSSVLDSQVYRCIGITAIQVSRVAFYLNEDYSFVSRGEKH